MPMSETTRQDELFGEIAVARQLVARDKLERALVVQRCIINRTRVDMPIGTVMQKMGLLTQEQVEQILQAQSEPTPAEPVQNPPEGEPDPAVEVNSSGDIDLVISSDKLTATIAPLKEGQKAPSLEVVKQMLLENGIAYGIVSDQLLASHLEKKPMPPDPFVVARGMPPQPGHPPEIRCYFDTDPMRIGTLLEDGSMDWKNRGEIPQVMAGDLLAEKVGGDPGKPGTNVLGQEIAPPRIKDAALKCGKGAERSEDAQRILAKISGTPKLEPDGRVSVFSILPFQSDIGIETGNIDFDGHIEVDGGISSGYSVRGKSLNTREIQNATIETSEDVVCFGGVYGSTVKAGGHLKVSHIHNSTVEVIGDLVVEKEIFGCMIEVNGRCLIDEGKIIASKIAAKKGIQVKDVGTQAARPSELTVGVDFKNERELKACREELADLERRKKEAADAIVAQKTLIDQLETELGKVAQDQDGCMVQKRQLEEKLRSPAISKNPEKSSLLEELIDDLATKYDALDKRVQAIMARDDRTRNQITQLYADLKKFDQQITETNEKMSILEEAAKLDPGIPVVKASGVVYNKTVVIGPHKKIIISQEMQGVRIAEFQEDPKQYQMKITSLR
ncbi:MAG: DUF342 domain-containing protein [Desulfobacteraceae bacterium]|nr:MAG: DUF342 domain-containing protein [Desulfobacteraceae bacterium]